MEKISTDILIIGAGAAGIRAAAAAKGADVLIISKGRPTCWGSTFSNISKGWGIQAILDDERTDAALELFYNDIISAGLGACCEKLVRILVEESEPRLRDLLAYGVVFRKGPDGNFVKAKGCFSNSNRAYLTEDISNVRSIFSAQINKRHVKILTGHIADLIISENECLGAWAFIDNRMVMIQSKAVIMTAGGGAGIFEHNLVDEFSVGDGYAIAYRAGAELNNLEFIQFMLGLKINESRQFLPVHQIDAGLRLINSRGDDLLDREIDDQHQRAAAIEQRAKHAPFSCRDLSRQVDFAVAKARLSGEKVHAVYEEVDNESCAVDHYAHAFNGGIVINEMAESTVKGLFAAGEAAAGPHGADRVGGCMMTATQVFGRIAGGNAAERARQMENRKTSERMIKYDKPVTPLQIGRDTGLWISAIESEIKKTMQRFVSVIRDEAGLLESRKILVDLENGLEEILSGVSGFSEEISRVENMILTGKLVIDSALRRKKSLGSHFRIDS
jgi:L-aspartate oxidase